MSKTTRKTPFSFLNIPKEERLKNSIKGALIAGYRPYSKDEDAFLIQNYQKIPFTKMAIHFGRAPSSVKNRAKRLIRDGLIKNPASNNHYSKKEDQFIIANQDLMSFAEVGIVLGRSRDSVKERAGKLGVSYRKIAEDSPVAKLSNDDVELIRQLSEAGLNYTEISNKFEVDCSHVRKICTFEARLFADKQDFVDSVSRQVSAIDGMN